METVTYSHPTHGTHVVTSAALDAAMARYLPASPAKLREIVESRTELAYGDVTDASAFLVILADFDYNTDDSPLRAY